jgi:hypothetical protein
MNMAMLATSALCIKRTKLIVALCAFVNFNSRETFGLTVNTLYVEIDHKD